MARLRTMAISPGRGSAGDATYRQTRGRTIMSAKIKQNKSNTALQQSQRGAFAFVSQWLNYMGYLTSAFDKTKYGSETNAAIKLNRKLWTDHFWHDPAERAVISTENDFINCMVELAEYDRYFASGAAKVIRVRQFYWENVDEYEGYEIIADARELMKPGGRITLTWLATWYAQNTPEVAVWSLYFNDVGSRAAVQALNSTQWNNYSEADTFPGYVDASGFAHMFFPLKGIMAGDINPSDAANRVIGVGWTWVAGSAIITLPYAGVVRNSSTHAIIAGSGIINVSLNGANVTNMLPAADTASSEVAVAEPAAAKKVTKKAKTARKEDCNE